MEYRKKCNVCGKIWCYTDEDIKQNTTNSALTLLASVGTIANAICGTPYHAYEQSKMSDRAYNKIVDFEKCPNCNSRNIKDLSIEEFNKLQKQNELQKYNKPIPSISINANASVDNIIKRIELFMEDEEWDSADIYCEQALDLNPDNGYLWLLKLLIDYKWRLIDGKIILREPIREVEESKYYSKINKFENEDSELKNKLNVIRNEITEYRYNSAIKEYKSAYTIHDYENIMNKFKKFSDYKDSPKYIQLCDEKIMYKIAMDKFDSDILQDIEDSRIIFEKHPDWHNSNSMIDNCKKKYEDIYKAQRKNIIRENILKGIFIIALIVLFIIFLKYLNTSLNTTETTEEKTEEISF